MGGLLNNQVVENIVKNKEDKEQPIIKVNITWTNFKYSKLTRKFEMSMIMIL